MAFQQGLSGLNVYSKALDVVSNNIANASTVGFKGSDAHFADVYAGALNGASSKQIGIGVSLMAVQQNFNQGNLTITSNALDMAINGNGFFRVQKSPDDQTGYYTRNGQFHLDKDGYIVNSNGTFLTGFGTNDGVTVNTASIVPLTVGTGGIVPQQTGWTEAVNPGQGGLTMAVNLDNRDKHSLAAPLASDPEWVQLQPFAWDATFNPNMFNYSTSAAIYDQTGAEHSLTNYYVRVGNDGAALREWAVYTVIDNKYLVAGTGTPPTGTAPGTPAPTITLEFEPNGTLITSTGGVPVPVRVPLDLSNTTTRGGGAADLTDDGPAAPPVPPAPPNVAFNWFDQTPGYAFNLNFGETTQYGMKSDNGRNTQDGYRAGTLTNLSVSQEGYVVGSYSNGQQKMMGQVVLAEFTNPVGLQSASNNLWIETYTSGQPTIGQPGGGTRGIVQSGEVEDSNVDLTQELVNMIVFQRNYQANAQTIKTQDQILQTLVNLR
ncbi:flagellar hook protein FlgE [Betaproteobacteria bacterium]|nr:flagellar hook protein FlgE [Betaproteobacteria bacterium]GHU13313.1 flagellar hook protein FlgE [Betaproteobacteria bacterium]